MISVTLRFRGPNGERLEGAVFSISTADGSAVVSGATCYSDEVSVCDSDWIGDTPINGRIEAELVPGAEYVLTESRAPLFRQVFETAEGDDASMVVGFKPAFEARFTAPRRERCASVVVRHEASGESWTEDKDGNRIEGAALPHGQRLSLALRHPVATVRSAVRGARSWVSEEARVVGRYRPKPGDGRYVAQLAVIGAVAVSAVWLALLAPFALCTAIGLASLGADGFGPEWALGSLGAYLSRYALRGWDAWQLLAGTYPQLAPALTSRAAIVLLPWAAALAFGAKRVARLLDPKNEIVDGLPPAAKGANEGLYGHSRLISSRKEVAKLLDPVKGVQDVPAADSVYAGFMPDAGTRRLAKEVKGLAADAADWLAEGFGQEAVERQPIHRPKPGGTMLTMELEAHEVIPGDTGAGKTRRYLIPNIATLFAGQNRGRNSLVALDPKGELYGLLGPYLRSIGVNVVVIDFSNVSRSQRWNPLQYAIDCKARKDHAKCVEAVREVVEAIAPRRDDEGPSRYFNDGARARMISGALNVIYDPNCPMEQKTLATVARIDAQYGVPTPVPGSKNKKETFNPYEAMLERLGPGKPAYDNYAGARNAPEEQQRNFASTTATYLSIFTDRAIADMMSGNDVSIRDLATKPTALFFIVPSHKLAYQPLCTMFLDQVYKGLLDFAENGGAGTAGRLPMKVNFVCEELCSIPKWPSLSTALNISRSMNLRFFLIIQSKAIFEDVYGDQANAILPNSEHVFFLQTNDAERTARWISEKVGTYAAEQVSVSHSGPRFGPKLHTTRSVAPVKREVLMPSDVLTWRAKDIGALVLGHYANPVAVPLPDISETPFDELLGLGDQEHNLRKIYQSRFVDLPEREGLAQPDWWPEFASGSKAVKWPSGQEEWSDMRRAFVAKLAKEHMERSGQAGGGRTSWIAVFDPGNGSAAYSGSGEEVNAAIRAAMSCDRARIETFPTKAKAEAWLASLGQPEGA